MAYFILKQLPCPTPESFNAIPEWTIHSLADFIRARVLELSYTSRRLRPYAADILGTDPGEPYEWVPDRRALLTTEIDAAMLHVYGLDRSDAEHVLDSFPVLRNQEKRDYSEYRTKRLVLSAYDAMTRAAETGVPFVSPLDPPPGHGPRHAEQSA